MNLKTRNFLLKINEYFTCSLLPVIIKNYSIIEKITECRIILKFYNFTEKHCSYGK